MVKEALSSAREAGAQTELVLVSDKSIAPCDGCGSCRETGSCHIQDDMQSIYQQLEKADAIIFGSPVYFNSVSAQAKAIMDRTYALTRDMKLKGKIAAPVLATRRTGSGQTRHLLYGYFIRHGMMPVRGAVGFGQEKGEVRQGVGANQGLSALEEARTVGTDVIQMVQQFSKT